MANTLKYGSGVWATKKGSSLAYNDQDDNYKPLPFTADRASTATRVNKEGLIEVVGQDKLRIDYTDSTKGVALLEPVRRNLVLRSEELDNGAWIKLANTTVTANQITAPDGTNNADEMSATATSTSLIAVQDAHTVTASTDYVVSFFAKKGDIRYVQLFHGSGQVSDNPRTNFDLEDGVVSAESSNHDSSMVDYGNGWYRCITKLTTFSVTNLQIYINGVATSNAARSATNSWTAGDDFYVWGVQLEDGGAGVGATYPTSYIPTSGSSVTRVADTANGAGNSEVFNDSEGVLYVNAAALNNDGTFRTFSINNGATTNSILIGYANTSNKVIAETKVAGTKVQTNTVAVASALDFNKMAIKYKLNDYSLYVNGFELATDTSASVPTGLDELDIDRGDGVIPFYGKTKEVKVYDTALSDTDLEYLTSYRSLTEMATELNLNTL